MTNATISTPKRAPKRFTRVSVTLSEHLIEYTGLSQIEAREAARNARTLGRKVSTTRARVTGSSLRDPNPWHFTVISFAK
jgi:hypothetical protein